MDSRPRPPRLLCLALLSFASCAAGPARFLRVPKERISWPPISENPRVEVLMAYHSTRDVERSRGFWSSIFGFFLGHDELQLVSPYGLAVDEKDRLWIADPGAGGLHRLDLESGEHLFFRNAGRTKLKTPIGVALGPGGLVFLSDSTLGRIFVFDREGNYHRKFGSPNELGRPTGIAWDRNEGRLLVLDTTGGRILSFDPTGKRLGVHGRRGAKPGEFNFPTNLCIDRESRIYITDSMNFRIQILSPAFEPLTSFGVVGRGPGTFASPKGIAVDSQGHIYVADGMFDNIQIFDPKGRLLLAVGSKGSGLGNFYLPTGLYIDPKDRIFVADSGNARVQILKFHPREP